MCGVVGLISESQRNDLGEMASELLKALEYRGYDSTGAAIQGSDSLDVDLRKGVGAPSFLVKDLGITSMEGKLFCGQVRWATFGAVDEKNAQPHIVRCKTFIYGAHNGNVTNTEQLKQWLIMEGHQVLSDNDGEILIHLVEHFFALELAKHNVSDISFRKESMRNAIITAIMRVQGSFAAVVVDPVSETAWGIKNGSSLYAGIAGDEKGKFNLVSSDLSSILRYTRNLVPLSEGEFIEFSHDYFKVYAALSKTKKDGVILQSGSEISKTVVRSKLRHTDTLLKPEFTYFMEQEIAAQSETARAVINKFMGGSELNRKIYKILGDSLDLNLVKQIITKFNEMLSLPNRSSLVDFFNLEDFHLLSSRVFENRETIGELPVGNQSLAATFSSGESTLLGDLLPFCNCSSDRWGIRTIDAIFEKVECEDLKYESDRFSGLVNNAKKSGNHIYLAACGTSYHAAMAACLFFNEIAHVELIPILPGEFRGRYSNTVKDNDIVIAVSQSGETKDLIDILNDITETGHKVHTVGIVNNVNSTIAQEKSDIIIPLRCGPEIAVPATKSFINQITVFYTLALSTAENAIEEKAANNPETDFTQEQRSLDSRIEKLHTIPSLIEETTRIALLPVRDAATDIYLAPSIQILATRINAVAREGALKIREVVLNHSEGFEGAEFKHGPNTILGYNTVFGYDHFLHLMSDYNSILLKVIKLAEERAVSYDSIKKIISSLMDFHEGKKHTFLLSNLEEEILLSSLKDYIPTRDLDIPYPLIYITGPDERDVRLTISQINTHKIRGSSTIVIAEEDPNLRTAAEKHPANDKKYWSHYITVPRTGDTVLSVFTTTVVLQMLALEMSVRKMEFLDSLGISDHGVHPDVPKNVSKSITVD
ncbi:MAG: SIS domain-containing protein [Deltaproteobacteria bacterium]|nr:SIS domain-containing protein [Deltaproteobacteria bacterium]